MRVASKFPFYIQAAHESQSRFWTKRPTIDQLSGWLHLRLEYGGPAYIILDALDELEPSCRLKLLRTLHNLPHVSLKIRVTSRDLPEIGAELLDTWSIMVGASEQDLTTLVRARLRDAALASGSVEQAEAFSNAEDQILSRIIGLANNTYVLQTMYPTFPFSHISRFLLASVYLDRIVTCTKIEDITHHLTTLPLTLDAHYDEAWERCTGGSDVLRSHRARLILMWMSCVKHILATKTLREALSLSGYHSGQGAITDEEIVSSCAGFLEMESSSAPLPYYAVILRNGEEIIITRPPLSNILVEKWRTWISGSNEALEEVFVTDTTIHFAHQSAFTYLVQRRKILFPQSSSTITSACLLALSPNEVLCALPLYSTCFLEYDGNQRLKLCNVTDQTRRVPSLLYLTFPLYGVTWKDSAGKAVTWHDVGHSTWLVIYFLFMGIGIGFVGQLAFQILSRERTPVTAPSMAKYSAIFMERHAIRSPPAVILKACLRLGRGSLLYCGLVLLWAWPVVLRGMGSTITSVPLSLDIPKVAILIVWNLCTAVCSSGVIAVAISTPGRRSTVIRFWLFVHLVFLRCVALLFFVKVKR